ncbi:hypothetical protein [Actinophytocola sp. NPDC049390]|uniref:hypothetical protein n=1 Tax=Actinophytocola sp. NPDC049390 TaxID=3363894 RepID=UPI0037A45F75
MTTQETATTSNTAEYGSTVGIQAEQVHNATINIGKSDHSPEEKFRLGVSFLQDGVPARARELIREAIAHEYENAEVRFYWTMAMLSKRAYRDLSVPERDQLARIPDFLSRYPDDAWKRGLAAVNELLEGLHKGDPGPAMGSIQRLKVDQRQEIVRHLDLVLTGSAKEILWLEARQKAEAARLSGDRINRVWAYFEPKPAEPRAYPPKPAASTLSDWGLGILWSMLLAVSAVFLGSTALDSGQPLVMAACVVVVASGALAFRSSLEWRYRSDRLRAFERRHGDRRVDTPDRGFPAKVDEALKYNFGEYVPDGSERKWWLTRTAGIRAALREEIVDLYGQDDDITVGNVRWLIRHLARDVCTRYEARTLRAYREEWSTRLGTKLTSALSLPVFVVSLVAVAVTGVRAHTVLGTVVVFVLLVGVRVTAECWSRIVLEQRRFADDQRLHDEELAARREQHDEWVSDIASRLPNETEMETWLNCDKTIMLDRALRHYKLTWQDVIAHAFLQTPALRYKRARTEGYPWRYSRYDMRLFLITRDGVREYQSEFDFERVFIDQSERNNFRFDAVSSVGVVITSTWTYTLKLTLTNGPSNDIRIMDPTQKQDTATDREAFSELNLDAAGFRPTLHILEGIAAEGKGWIGRDPQLRRPVGSTIIDDMRGTSDVVVTRGALARSSPPPG